jgi:hypothetical protein
MPVECNRLAVDNKVRVPLRNDDVIVSIYGALTSIANPGNGMAHHLTTVCPRQDFAAVTGRIANPYNASHIYCLQYYRDQPCLG